MRTVERLIEEARESTNIDSQDAVTDKLCLAYLNRIQSHIQDIISTSNTESRFFKGTATFNIQPGYDTYQLPFDIYNKNSINSVQVRYSSGSSYSYATLKKISEKRRGQETGYYVYDDKIVLTPIPLTTDTIVISYQKKIPKLGLRKGIISDVTAPVITCSNLLGTTLALNIADEFCTNSSSGSIVTYNNKIDSETFTTIDTSDVTGIVVGDIIVTGEYSSFISRLPDECEPLMIEMLERMMHARLSSKDMQISSMFTSEILSRLEEVFKENSGDVFTPPSTEFTEWI